MLILKLFIFIQVYNRIMNEVVSYFHEQGITKVTIQPEFKSSDQIISDCLVKCVENSCADKICCKNDEIGITLVTHVDNAEESNLIHPQVNVISNDRDIHSSIMNIKRKSKSLVDLNDCNNSDYIVKRRLSSGVEKDEIQTIPPQTTSISSTNLTSHPFISESHLSKNDARLMSEMPDDFEFNFNVETFNIDQIGKTEQMDEKITAACIKNFTDDDDTKKERDITDESLLEKSMDKIN